MRKRTSPLGKAAIYPLSFIALLFPLPRVYWDECIKENCQIIPLLEHYWAYMVQSLGVHVVRWLPGSVTVCKVELSSKWPQQWVAYLHQVIPLGLGSPAGRDRGGWHPGSVASNEEQHWNNLWMMTTKHYVWRKALLVIPAAIWPSAWSFFMLTRCCIHEYISLQDSGSGSASCGTLPVNSWVQVTDTGRPGHTTCGGREVLQGLLISPIVSGTLNICLHVYGIFRSVFEICALLVTFKLVGSSKRAYTFWSSIGLTLILPSEMPTLLRFVSESPRWVLQMQAV